MHLLELSNVSFSLIIFSSLFASSRCFISNLHKLYYYYIYYYWQSVTDLSALQFYLHCYNSFLFFFFNIYSQQSTFCPSILLSVSSQWNTAEHFHCFFELSDYVTVLSFNCFFVTLNRELKFSFLMFFHNFGIISENVSFEFSLSGVVSEPKPYALILDFFSYKVQ